MISSLISSLYVAPQLAHIHMIHSPHQSFHLASQPSNLGANCPLTMFSYEMYFSDTVPGISPLLNIISRLSNMHSIWRAAGQTWGKLPRHDILLFAPHARISRPSASVMYQTQTFEQMVGYSIGLPGYYVLWSFGKSEKVSHSLTN